MLLIIKLWRSLNGRVFLHCQFFFNFSYRLWDVETDSLRITVFLFRIQSMKFGQAKNWFSFVIPEYRFEATIDL